MPTCTKNPSLRISELSLGPLAGLPLASFTLPSLSHLLLGVRSCLCVSVARACLVGGKRTLLYPHRFPCNTMSWKWHWRRRRLVLLSWRRLYRKHALNSDLLVKKVGVNRKGESGRRRTFLVWKRALIVCHYSNNICCLILIYCCEDAVRLHFFLRVVTTERLHRTTALK